MVFRGGFLPGRTRFVCIAAALSLSAAEAQIATFPYNEGFDSVFTGHLPAGWLSTSARNPGVDDMAVSTSTPRSSPQCVMAVNATVAQALTSPVFTLTAVTKGEISLWTRRSASFKAHVVCEGSSDGGTTFPFAVGDTLGYSGSTSYSQWVAPLPGELAGRESVRFRWRIVPDATGTTGTMRFDDVAVAPSDPREEGKMVINEIMFAPISGEPEWVELANAGPGTTNLRGMQISDASTGSKHTIIPVDLLVAQGEYVVLTRDSVLLAGARLGIPGRVISVAGFPSLNNGGDEVHLFNSRGEGLDSVAYAGVSASTPEGRSLERWDTGGISSDPVNWGLCNDPARGTPGRENSIARREYDIRMSGGNARWREDGMMEIGATVCNVGRHSVQDVSVEFIDMTASAPGGKLIARVEVPGPIGPRDSLPVPAMWEGPAPGNHIVAAIAIMAADQRRANDTARFLASAPAPPGNVVINEIMFAPLAGEAEYIEVFNAGDCPMNLAGWTLTDRPGVNGKWNSARVNEDGPILEPGGFAVIAQDSSIFRFFPGIVALDPRTIILPRGGFITLNNEGDDVILHDPLGNTVDSVRYVPEWHNPALLDRTGVSLERILVRGLSSDASNWTSCVLPIGGTPGSANSVAAPRSTSATTLSCRPNPFSPDSDGKDDATVIHYNLPEGVWSVSLRVFDVRGRLIRRLVTAVPGAGKGDAVWDGRDDERMRGRVGIYVILLEAVNQKSGEIITAKSPVVLAGRL